MNYVKREDRIGQVFGRLTVIGISPKYPDVLCKCTCGTTKEVSIRNLLNGNTRSCGCLRDEASKSRLTTHGMKGTPTWNSWSAMRSRVYDRSDIAYQRYGGSGVKVDPRWDSFETFLLDMGERPKGKTLDRFPNKQGDYCKENCRWATLSEQARNRVTNIIVTHKGKDYTLVDFCSVNKLDYTKTYNRFSYIRRKNSGISTQEAFELTIGDSHHES